MTNGPRRAAAAPLVVLIDFDGTIAPVDIGDEVMARFADRDSWAPLEAAYLTGAIGSRSLLIEQAALLHGDVTLISSIDDHVQLAPDFIPFVGGLRAHGVPIEVVSDGFGFYVRPSLERMGLADLPVFTARTMFSADGPDVDFPDGHSVCRVCGTCKRERILVHRAAGRFVVFIGDGLSDLYAAGHADLVYAKDHLADLCAGQGWPYRPWTSFSEIGAELDGMIVEGVPRPRTRPFMCGPEVWPPGTTKPIWDRPPAVRRVTQSG